MGAAGLTKGVWIISFALLCTRARHSSQPADTFSWESQLLRFLLFPCAHCRLYFSIELSYLYLPRYLFRSPSIFFHFFLSFFFLFSSWASIILQPVILLWRKKRLPSNHSVSMKCSLFPFQAYNNVQEKYLLFSLQALTSFISPYLDVGFDSNNKRW